jgi:hypothetical protein
MIRPCRITHPEHGTGAWRNARRRGFPPLVCQKQAEIILPPRLGLTSYKISHPSALQATLHLSAQSLFFFSSEPTYEKRNSSQSNQRCKPKDACPYLIRTASGIAKTCKPRRNHAEHRLRCMDWAGQHGEGMYAEYRLALHLPFSVSAVRAAAALVCPPALFPLSLSMICEECLISRRTSARHHQRITRASPG